MDLFFDPTEDDPVVFSECREHGDYTGGYCPDCPCIWTWQDDEGDWDIASECGHLFDHEDVDTCPYCERPVKEVDGDDEVDELFFE